MSTNTVRARVSFSFKGETHELDSVIDLDRVCSEMGAAPDFHRLLAQQAGIDPYSYLYEVLESHEIEFSDATGAAAGSCREGQFDWSRFAQDAAEERDWQAVRVVAEPVLGVRDWDAEPAVKAALLAAYRAGRAAATRLQSAFRLRMRPARRLQSSGAGAHTPRSPAASGCPRRAGADRSASGE